MKKNLFIIPTIIIIISSIHFVSYADCNMNLNYKKLIDFSEVINDDDVGSITQTIDGKEVMITRYEQISKIAMHFEKEIFDRVKILVQDHNSNIDTNVFIHILSKVMDLFAHTGITEDNALNQIRKVIDDETLSNLNKKEQKEAAVDGRDSAIVPTLGTATLCAGLGYLSKPTIEKIAGLIFTKLGLTAGEGIGAAVATVTGGILVPVFGFLGIGKLYNKFYVEPFTQRLSNLLSAFKYVYSVFKDDVINHRWIGGNVLITAIPSDGSCNRGYSHFHNIDGIHFSKSQKAINWEFAKAECKFLNADHDDCYQKAKETIECLWDNLDDPSKCESNPYYYGNAEKYEL